MGRSKGERPLGRPRYGWENKIKMDKVEICWTAWTGLILFTIPTRVGLL